VRTEDDRARLRRRIATRLGNEVRQHETLIASTEHLSALLQTENEVASFAEFVHSLVDDVVIVAVLRRGDYWLPSSYSEAVLNDKQLEFDAGFVEFRAPLLDHHAFLARWQAAFGREAVRLLPMLESDKDDPSAVPLRVLGQAGVQSQDSSMWQHPAQLAHPTLSALGTEMLRAVSPMLPTGGLRPGRHRRRVRAVIAARFPGPGLALTPAAAAELDRRGWRRSGIDAVPAAIGREWLEWRSQPDADVRPLPEIREDDLQNLLDELRTLGLLAPRQVVLADTLRRVGVRLARR
jgi:hypothetical protein